MQILLRDVVSRDVPVKLEKHGLDEVVAVSETEQKLSEGIELLVFRLVTVSMLKSLRVTNFDPLLLLNGSFISLLLSSRPAFVLIININLEV